MAENKDRESLKEKATFHVLFFAFANSRKRFFLPSSQNFFGEVPMPFCMIDSGANTFLLPLDDKLLGHLDKLYGNERYFWSISQSGGVGALACPVLVIKDLVGNIPIEFCKDIWPFKTSSQNLRFHVSYEDAKLLQKSNKLSKDEDGLLRLKDFVGICDSIKKIDPEIKIGERRRHALIGQGLLFNYVVIQKDMIIVILNKEKTEDLTLIKVYEICAHLELIAEKTLGTSFVGKKEFDALEDDDHDLETYHEDDLIGIEYD